MKVAGKLLHQGCPLPWAAEEQFPCSHETPCAQPLHAQMAFEFKKNSISVHFACPCQWMALVWGVRAGFCPQSPKVGGDGLPWMLGCEPFLAALRACDCHAPICIGLILFRTQAEASRL